MNSMMFGGFGVSDDWLSSNLHLATHVHGVEGGGLQVHFSNFTQFVNDPLFAPLFASFPSSFQAPMYLIWAIKRLVSLHRPYVSGTTKVNARRIGPIYMSQYLIL